MILHIAKDTDVVIDIGQRGLTNVKPLDVCEVVDEEDPGREAGEAGAAHVEHLGVAGHQGRDGGVQQTWDNAIKFSGIRIPFSLRSIRSSYHPKVI